MKAILLCAGFGTRMYPLTRDVPKPLLPVAGSTILDDLIDQLVSRTPIREAIIVSNGRFADRFEAWSERAALRHRECDFVVLNDGARDDASRLGATQDLAFALEARELREPVVVAAGDNLFRFDMARFFSDYAARPRSLVLRYREPGVERLRRTGVAEVDSDGRLVRLVEKPENPSSPWACPAFYLLQADALALLPRFVAADEVAVDAIGRFIGWLCERVPVFTHEMRGRRLDVGNKDDYARAEAWIASTEIDGNP